MKTENFEIEFTFEQKIYIGYCTRFKVHKVPQVYVWITDKDKEHSFTLYEVNKSDQMLFYYPLADKRLNGFLKAIDKTLLGN